MSYMEILCQVIGCSADSCAAEEDLGAWSKDELAEHFFCQGWLSAASMAVGNARKLFSNPREAVELLFEELASDADEGEGFVMAMMEMVDDGAEVSHEAATIGAGSHSAWDDDHIRLGERGEQAAAKCLERKGYKILERNWRCRYGEADIIALDPNGTVVFVEVKTRRSRNTGLPEEAVSRSKRRRYESIALEYMATHEWEDGTPLRFDAIAICVNAPNRAILRHHVGFFDGCI